MGCMLVESLRVASVSLVPSAWARMAKVAQDKLAEGGDQAYLKTKLVTGKFFMERMLPETSLRLTRISAGADTMMSLAEEMF